ncbi:MAG: hypothetical protein A4E63_02432 [Syntrophorhabdus sp. PtaU1.Bin050]|nr:MAG: hypothetical protein A4E63_02432 [Syntrophorhabdus sp. PtaU1.Bin050]
MRQNNLLKVQKRLIEKTSGSPTIATIDQDASVIESAKEEAQPTYRGIQAISRWSIKQCLVSLFHLHFVSYY